MEAHHEEDRVEFEGRIHKLQEANSDMFESQDEWRKKVQMVGVGQASHKDRALNQMNK